LARRTLNRDLLRSEDFSADRIERPNYGPLPERVLQFGEGNFLRGFVDWMVHELNRRALFNGSVVVIKPRPARSTWRLNEQNGLFSLVQRGLERRTPSRRCQIIGSISRGIDPYSDYDAFLSCADNPQLRFIISNTTEAGIQCDARDQVDQAPPHSFPGKLTAFLYRRFQQAGRGCVILPCELIENNGQALLECVKQTAGRWKLRNAFMEWLAKENTFADTLVDRIVSGYPPEDEARQLTEEFGYDDSLLVTSEIYHSWVIQADPAKFDSMPFAAAGLNVAFTDDLAPFRQRKVRILNGAHTMIAAAGYLAGSRNVRQCVQDPMISRYLRDGLFEEILPTLGLPEKELLAFAESVLERFGNPFIDHRLLSIALNSTSKWKSRILPSLLDYFRHFRKIPQRLAFSMAALIEFYRSTSLRAGALIGTCQGEDYPISDEPHALEAFRDAYLRVGQSDDPGAIGKLTAELLSQKTLWGDDLSQIDGFVDAVAAHLRRIRTEGMRAAMSSLPSTSPE
jgi:tagaturonate reductase